MNDIDNMQTTYNIYSKVENYIGRLLVFWLLCTTAQLHARAAGEHAGGDTIVVACNWELPPYEFSNDEGHPDGFHVELLKWLLDKVNLKYRFVMLEGYQSVELFKHHEADIIVDVSGRLRQQNFCTSRNVLSYYRRMVALKLGQPHSGSLDRLGSRRVFVRTYDEPTRQMVQEQWPQLKLNALSANDGLMHVSANNEAFIWGEEPLKWFIREMNLTDVELVDMGLPVNEMHIIGHDKELIDEIDDQLSRLEQSGQLEQLRDKWFHPERVHNDTSPIAVYVTLGVLLLALALLSLNRLVKSRVRVAMHRMKDIENIMLQSLTVSKYVIIEFNQTSQRFVNIHGEFLPPEGLSRTEILEHIHPDERSMVSRNFLELLNKKKQSVDLNLRWRTSVKTSVADDDDWWQYIGGHAILENDGMASSLRVVCAVKFVTEQVKEERVNSQLGNRYTKIFETSMIAMSFYTADGRLIALNQKMRELCDIDNLSEKFFTETNLFDNPLVRNDFPPGSREMFHFCQHMYYPELELDSYIEMRIRPVIEENGKVAYYTVTARDVSDERLIYLEQLRHDKELQRVNQQIRVYEDQLHFLLVHSDMWVWRSDVVAKKVSFSRSLRHEEFSLSFEKFLDGFVPGVREAALKSFGYMQGVDRNLNSTYEFVCSPINGGHQWLSADGIPVYDDDGKVKGHFGIVRDVTKLMEAQKKLRQETKRADESGMLKSVFLANMTHEIRTPLNAIVGFSDLLQVVDDQNERKEFIRIIRSNCDMLLRLINDIIEASNMNQGPIAINAAEVDFAVAFNDICQTLSQRVQEQDVQFIVDNPYQSFNTKLDKGRMQQVITNFTTNAVKYTHHGHIKVGYRYLSLQQLRDTVKQTFTDTQDFSISGIYMYCEDTGAGIPKEKQDAVFERFVKLNDYVQGTGLGLSICKTIAERCGGRIGVNSEGEGHGSTFWIWIPCVRLEPKS